MSVGDLLHTFNDHGDYTNVMGIDFSPDGTMLATGGAGSGSQVYIYDMSGNQIKNLTDMDSANAVKFSNDGTKLAVTGCSISKIKIYDVTDNFSFIKEIPTTSAAKGLDWSPDDSKLAARCDASIGIYDYATGSEDYSFSSVSMYNKLHVAFSPDGNRIAGHKTNKTAGIWSLEDGSLINELTWKESSGRYLQCVDWSNDGDNVLLSGYYNCESSKDNIVIRDYSDATKINGWISGASGSGNLTVGKYSPDGGHIATVHGSGQSQNGTLEIYDTVGNNFTSITGLGNFATNLAWHPTKTKIAVGLKKGEVRIYESGLSINNPPSIDSMSDVTISEGDLLQIQPSGSDPDDDELTFYAEGDLADFHDPNLGRLEWKPGYGQAGTYNVTFIADDGFDQDSTQITVTVEESSVSPTITPISDFDVLEKDNISFQVQVDVNA